MSPYVYLYLFVWGWHGCCPFLDPVGLEQGVTCFKARVQFCLFTIVIYIIDSKTIAIIFCFVNGRYVAMLMMVMVIILMI